LVIGLEIRGGFKNSDRPAYPARPPRWPANLTIEIARRLRVPQTVTPSAAAVGLLEQPFGAQKQGSAREEVYGVTVTTNAADPPA
jgi:hypothetical protein